MAVVRARSAPPYGLFASVALAVLCAGAAIVFYVLWSKQSSDYENAQRQLDKIATTADQRNIVPGLQPGPTDKTSSVLQIAKKRIDDLQASLTKAQADLDAATTTLQQRQGDLDRANLTAKSASEKAAAVERDAQTALAGSQTSIGEKDSTIKKLQDDLAAAKAAYDQAVADGEKKLNDAQVKAEQDARDNVLKLEANAATIAKQETEIQELRKVVINGRKGADVAVGESDGNVIRVDGAAGNVWITLTKADRIQPGMTFTTYDPRTGVRFGTDDQAQGNGSIEVIQVGERNSLCRITRTTKNRAIQAGDMISNLVYHSDKTREFRFVIVGDFDLDGDGNATAAERDRIIAMVKSWGGVVDNNVTSQTDYLVMGKPPASPATVVDATNADATAPGSIVDQRSKEQQSYDEMEQAARRLAIPVLNANRFLSMIGYFNTTVVRY